MNGCVCLWDRERGHRDNVGTSNPLKIDQLHSVMNDKTVLFRLLAFLFCLFCLLLKKYCNIKRWKDMKCSQNWKYQISWRLSVHCFVTWIEITVLLILKPRFKTVEGLKAEILSWPKSSIELESVYNLRHRYLGY